MFEKHELEGGQPLAAIEAQYINVLSASYIR